MASIMSVMLTWINGQLFYALLLHFFAILSGFWGEVITDLIQFMIVIFGSVALAIISLEYVGGMETLSKPTI